MSICCCDVCCSSTATRLPRKPSATLFFLTDCPVMWRAVPPSFCSRDGRRDWARARAEFNGNA
eukprot:scaffold12036_cov61-Phaeocystis_antarctica.AAC.4